MTGDAKPSDITAHGMFIFHSFIFYMPMILLVVAALIYQFKIPCLKRSTLKSCANWKRNWKLKRLKLNKLVFHKAAGDMSLRPLFKRKESALKSC